MFNLCETFHKLPSEIDGEDELTIKKLLIIMDERNKLARKESKRLERKARSLRRR